MALTEDQEPKAPELDDIIGDGDDPFLPPPPPPRPVFIASLPTTPLAEGKLAYHEGDYVTAAEQLQAVIDSDDYDDESRVAAAYWRAEALSRQNMAPEAIGHFEAVAEAYAGHRLASAASRRAESLRVHFDIISGADA